MGNATDTTLDALNIGMRVRKWTRAQLECEHDHHLEFYSLPWQAAIIREYDRRANIVETHGARGRRFLEMVGDAACFAIIIGAGWLAWTATPAWAADHARIASDWTWGETIAAWIVGLALIFSVYYVILPPKRIRRDRDSYDERDGYHDDDTVEKRVRESGQ
jgi:hypothetical protein